MMQETVITAMPFAVSLLIAMKLSALLKGGFFLF